jgi:hypothetical protein
MLVKNRVMSSSAAWVLIAAHCSGGVGGGASPVQCTKSATTCPSGAVIEACVTTAADGTCESEYYSVGSRTFACASCSDCTAALQSASSECGTNGMGAPPSDGGGNPSAAFLGRWSCDQNTTLTFTMPAGTPPSTSQATGMLTTSPTTSGFEIPVGDADAGGICLISFATSGSTGTLLSEQCTFISGSETTTESFTSGSATLSSNMLTIVLQFTLSSSPLAVRGTGSSQVTCTKL